MRAFVEITIDTRERKIFDAIGAAMFLGNDVLNMQQRKGGILLL